jgi:FkbM family methyltransferase
MPYIANALSHDFQIMLADVGSAGGLHKRWRRLGNHVTAILSDPLDETTQSGRDIYLPFALGSETGEKPLYITRRVTMTSTLKPHVALLERFWDKPQHTEIVKKLIIPVHPLDTALQERNVQLDAIKIDVQGGELDILKGAANALKTSILTAEIEVSFIDRYKDQARFWDINAFMESMGFALMDISRIKKYRHNNASEIKNPWLGLGKRTGQIAFCDALYVRRYDELLRQKDKPGTALKAILLLLVYGKADLAAQLFDSAKAQLDPSIAEALEQEFKRIARWDWGKLSPHHILDYLASKC